MTDLSKDLNEPEFKGLYGSYQITMNDKKEVQNYRLSVLICGISFTSGLIQWLIWGPSWVWIPLLLMVIGLGLALKWIHIYLSPLHKALQILWCMGCIGIATYIVKIGPENILVNFIENPISTIAIGPMFAALTGLGFKEFFCFRRPEAIGLTALVPIALLGHITQIFNSSIVMGILMISAFLLLTMALKKFGTDPSADIGDKSVFEYLQNNKQLIKPV